MVEFWIYDVVFLVLFVAWILYFLKKNEKTLDKEGWMYMYRTKWGINLINRIAKKYNKLLGYLRYVVVITGYFLMAGIVYLFGVTVFRYIRDPWITEVIKAPPVAPLIPYFPQLFGVESFFPNFYFTYFLVAIAIVAFVHEFSHGIFMKFAKIKIKSTGIVFLGPILGAFVEENKKSFDGKGRFNRLSVLGAGVFANVITGIIFLLLAWGLFNVAYVSEGYIITDYEYTSVPLDSILGVENYSDELVLVDTVYGDYFWLQDYDFSVEDDYVKLYLDSPAIRKGVQGNIVLFNGEKVTGRDQFQGFFDGLKPGDQLILKTVVEDGREYYYGITLAEHPGDNETGFLGIVGGGLDPKAGLGEFSIYSLLLYLKGSAVDYQPVYSFFGFMFNLLWWIVIINFLVALFNMLPLGILDGGQFFYVSLLGITKSDKFSKGAYKFITWLIAYSFLVLMLVWAWRVFF
jgi:membrane-associated protease RseP (regulator of RpoE activity)